MPNKTMEFIKKHIKEHLFVYLLVVLCFLIGISVGAFTVKIINTHQKQELIAYLRGFFQLFEGSQLRGVDILKESLKNNLQLLLFNWILGVIIIGLPVVFVIIGFKGFVIGFTVGLLIEEFKLYGGLLFLFSVLPQNIILIPVFIFGAVTSVGYSLQVARAKMSKQRSFSLSKQLWLFSSIHLVLAGIIVVAALIESFIIPFFLSIIVKFML